MKELSENIQKAIDDIECKLIANKDEINNCIKTKKIPNLSEINKNIFETL